MNSIIDNSKDKFVVDYKSSNMYMYRMSLVELDIIIIIITVMNKYLCFQIFIYKVKSLTYIMFINKKNESNLEY